MSNRVTAGGKPSKGTPKDKRLKKNQAKVTRATVVENQPSIRQQLGPAK